MHTSASWILEKVFERFFWGDGGREFHPNWWETIIRMFGRGPSFIQRTLLIIVSEYGRYSNGLDSEWQESLDVLTFCLWYFLLDFKWQVLALLVSLFYSDICSTSTNSGACNQQILSKSVNSLEKLLDAKVGCGTTWGSHKYILIRNTGVIINKDTVIFI